MDKEQNDRKNQIYKMYSEIFTQIYSTDYYEGTEYGKYYNKFDKESGESSVYVKDPLEEQFHDFFDTEENSMKYLVGFTGMGKTTLIRNFFKIYDQGIQIRGDIIIAYISFYNVNLSQDMPQTSVEQEIKQNIQRLTQKLIEENQNCFFDCLDENRALQEKKLWKELYLYIENNRPSLLEGEDFLPGNFSFVKKSNMQELDEKEYEYYTERLKIFARNQEFEYHLYFLKFVINKIEKYRKIIFIYDDIESKVSIFHPIIIELARHVYSSFLTLSNNNKVIKALVAIRTYTFRGNVGRQAAARREYIINDVIFKKKTVSLHEIFEKRVNECQLIRHNSSEKDTLIKIENRLKDYEELMLKLTNYNLAEAMNLFVRVLTNKKWIAKYEIETEGSFKFNPDIYNFRRSDVFRAIAYGNDELYLVEKAKYVPDILYAVESGGELLGLYMIKLFKNEKIMELYGDKYITGERVVTDLVNLFTTGSDAQKYLADWKRKLEDTISYLYKKGVFLRSLLDIEDTTNEQIERTYQCDYKLYLSPRGKCLYDLLNQHALLLEFHLLGKEQTGGFEQKQIFLSILEYLEFLFDCEKQNIAIACYNLRRYQELLGKELVISTLLEGTINNIRAYYSDRNDEYYMLKEKVQKLINSVKEYIALIEEKYNVSFYENVSSVKL